MRHCMLAGLVAWAGACFATEPVFTAPPGYVEAAPPGNVECSRGMQSLLSHKDLREFVLRNEVWPQEEGVDLSPESWSAGRAVRETSVRQLRPEGRKSKPVRAFVYVLVGGDGSVLDKRVLCSNRPEYAPTILEYLDSWEFEPSRYKRRGLNTVVPVHIES